MDYKKSTILLFDGECKLCNSLITFAIKRSKNIFFTPLQSPVGKTILTQFNYPSEHLNTLVFIHKEKAYIKSDAVLQIVRNLNGLWPALYVFAIIPLFIRDKIYDIIAKNRHKWFGFSNNCSLPDSTLMRKYTK